MLLNVHSYYSLRYGTMSLEDLVNQMRINGYDTVVLTDINNSTGVLEFIKLGRKYGINPIAGMEFRNCNELLYIGIAKNETGFKELNEFMTGCNRYTQPLPPVAPSFDHVFILYPFGAKKPEELKENERIGVQPTQLQRAALSIHNYPERYVIWSPVSFLPEDYQLHKQLRSIDNNILLSHLEPGDFALPHEVFIPKAELIQSYHSFPQIIKNTEDLLSQCSFHFDFYQSKNKKTFTGNRYDDKELLYKYAIEGLGKRYSIHDARARERVLTELNIIDELNFSSYFLISDDICRYARNRNFHYVGRGSGANSLVAYCLGITDVDPIELDLYFERFLNPKRAAHPDFDIDFSWKDRDEIYDYIFHRYQSDHTALVGAMSTFRSRSIIRELGKVYGLPKAEIDRMVHDPEHILNKNEVTDTILSVYQRMEDFPNQRTIHASGVLISELPLTSYSAIDYPPKSLPTMQFDMYTAENIKFDKFDILSQRGIGHIKDCQEIIKKNTGKDIDISNPKIFFKDKEIALQLKSANTIGCFYIESPAMRQLLTKLKCEDYLTLVAASSIIRPGVASSGMMKTYIERHHNPSEVHYLHPIFKEQLQDTYGVMVYQEDVMKIGHHFGGLDLADADVLRRMMSGRFKNRIELQNIEKKYFEHCSKMGYPEEVSSEVWRQMESFAGYSFNKAHSASFAVESYQSLYLKTYYPKEFMVAVLNNYGGFYNRKVYINEAKRAGATVCLPCINNSEYHTEIYGNDIYLGFDCLLYLEHKLALHIAEERKQNGLFKGIENFISRTGAGLEQVVLLIRAGAFRFLNINKKELLWQAYFLLSNPVKKEQQILSLFDTEIKMPVLPKLHSSVVEDMYDELELMGFTLSGSLFDLAKSSYRGDLFAKDLSSAEGKVVRITGEWIAEKTVRAKNGTLMKFGTFLDREGDFFDTVHFSPSLQHYPLRGDGLYLLEGKVIADFNCPSIEIIKCGKMPLQNDPRK